MSADLIKAWRSQAVAIITDPASTESQRALAWRFLKTWGAK
jgi:hypothetical protein